MHVEPTLEIRNKGWPPALNSFAQMLRRLYEALARTINGQLSFGNLSNLDNISGYWFSGTSPVGADTDFTITHSLGRVPMGYLVFSKAASCDVYTGSVVATSVTLTLRCTQSAIALVIFVT